MAFSLISPLTSSLKLSESWQFSGFLIEISKTLRPFSHKITPVLNNFLAHVKISINFVCFFYFNQRRHSCPGASSTILKDKLVRFFEIVPFL